MSDHSDITVRVSVPLILAQVVKTRRHLEDARKYVHRCLSDLFELECSICHSNHNYSLLLNAIDREYSNTNKWSVAYDADTTPSQEEVAALGDDAVTAHISIRGLRLVSPVLELNKTRAIAGRKKNEDHIHSIPPLAEISAVLHRLQQSQKTIGIIGGNDEVRSFLYPSSTNRMTVTIDSINGAFAEDIYSRVDRLLEGCARQYDFLVGCPKSSTVVEIFSISQPFTKQPEVPETDDDNDSFFSSSDAEEEGPFCSRHAFESETPFSQAPSTLSPAATLAWIDIAIQTVTCCRNATESYFTWQLSGDGEFMSPTFSALDLVQALGVHSSTADFYRNSLTTRNNDPDANEAVAEAMLAISVGNPLGGLALQVANAAFAAADPGRLRDRIKLRLLTGGYGWREREYARRALAAIGVEGVGEVEVEEERSGLRRRVSFCRGIGGVVRCCL